MNPLKASTFLLAEHINRITEHFGFGTHLHRGRPTRSLRATG
ncbi:hypothetical protein [Streptomyces durmitorensis]|nr:hypothetical protein [Streptomyces durmitorensis]